MQLADKLGTKRAIAKTDWDCWKKSEEQFERIHRPFLFDLDDNDQEQACWDACTRESCNADVSQMAKKMDMLPYDDPTRDRIRGCVRATRYRGRTIEHAT